MDLSIGTTFNWDIPLDRQMALCARAGFTHLSIGAGNPGHSGYLTVAGRQRMLRLLATHGMGVCSVHAPMDREADISSQDVASARRGLDDVRRSIEAALSLHAGVVVIHPSNSEAGNPEQKKMVLTEQVIRLLELIQGEPVRLAVENLPPAPTIMMLSYSLDTIAAPQYGFCYDSSHDNLSARPCSILEQHGHRLIATHISDNRGMRDDHMLPYEGRVNWDDFCRVFSAIDFNGIFLLEVEMRESAYQNADEFVREAYRRGMTLLQRSGKTS
ncbi:sugar phosphate isomerase/epimerase [bacterium]|nr:sugar phosphate isomerase/epimerase [bacterium]